MPTLSSANIEVIEPQHEAMLDISCRNQRSDVNLLSLLRTADNHHQTMIVSNDNTNESVWTPNEQYQLILCNYQQRQISSFHFFSQQSFVLLVRKDMCQNIIDHEITCQCQWRIETLCRMCTDVFQCDFSSSNDQLIIHGHIRWSNDFHLFFLSIIDRNVVWSSQTHFLSIDSFEFVEHS